MTYPSISSEPNRINPSQFEKQRIDLLHQHHRHVQCMLSLCIALSVINLLALPLDLKDLSLRHFNAYCALALCVLCFFSLHRLLHITNDWYQLHQRYLEQNFPSFVDEHYRKDSQDNVIYHTLNQPSEPWFCALLPIVFSAFFIGLLALNGGYNYLQLSLLGLF